MKPIALVLLASSIACDPSAARAPDGLQAQPAAEVVAQEPPPEPELPRPLPLPSPEEIEALRSPYETVQTKAARVLRKREPTEEVRAIVDELLATADDDHLEEQLLCLKARFRDGQTLDFILNALPKPGIWEPRRKRLASCYLEAIAARPLEERRPLVGLLVEYSFERDWGPARAALAALEGIEIEEMPPEVVRRSRSSEWTDRNAAIRTALVLDAVAHAPELVANALRDPVRNVSTQAVMATMDDPRPNAARAAANAVVVEPDDPRLVRIFWNRQRKFHDGTAALVEIAFDEERPTKFRLNALDLIRDHGDPGAATLLEPLLASSSPLIAEQAREATNALVAQLARGVKPKLRTLEP